MFCELASRKNFPFEKESFFFQLFQLHEMKTIDSIFAFSIICFSVYTKSISILLVLDLVVLDLVIALVLALVLCLDRSLLQLQIWEFLFAQQQQLILVLVFALVFVLDLVLKRDQHDVRRFLSRVKRLQSFSSSRDRIAKINERWKSQRLAFVWLFHLFYFSHLEIDREIWSSADFVLLMRDSQRRLVQIWKEKIN